MVELEEVYGRFGEFCRSKHLGSLSSIWVKNGNFFLAENIKIGTGKEDRNKGFTLNESNSNLKKKKNKNTRVSSASS